MEKILAILIPFLLLSGCLSSDEPTEEESYVPQIVEQKWENNSFQFWNIYPMSMANTTVLSFNQTGEVSVTVELEVFFHEPLLWGQGYLNYTLINENETLFSHQLSEGHVYFQMNLSNVSNLTIQIQASGSDNATDESPGDWFVARTYCEMKK